MKGGGFETILNFDAGDQFEHDAIVGVFGTEDPSAAIAVSSTKGATGGCRYIKPTYSRVPHYTPIMIWPVSCDPFGLTPHGAQTAASAAEVCRPTQHCWATILGSPLHV